MSKEISAVTLPYVLKRHIVGHLPLDEPQYAYPDVIYIRTESGEMFLDKDEILPAKRPKQLLGRVGIMCDAVLEDGEALKGYVADLRHIESLRLFEVAPPTERPSDEEEAASWDEETRCMVPLAAVAYKNPESGKIEVDGDERFAASAIRLAELTDRLEKKLKKKSKTKAKQKDKKPEDTEAATSPVV